MSTIVANTIYAGPMGSKSGPFGPWLQSELNRKGWNSARLAEEMSIDGPLFLSIESTQLTANGLHQAMARVGDLAGVHPCNPHRFRHTMAVTALRAGMGPLQLQLIMGHESLDMTRRYVKLAEQDIAAAARDHSPLDSLKISF